jgi:hypothetical protein
MQYKWFCKGCSKEYTTCHDPQGSHYPYYCSGCALANIAKPIDQFEPQPMTKEEWFALKKGNKIMLLSTTGLVYWAMGQSGWSQGHIAEVLQYLKPHLITIEGYLFYDDWECWNYFGKVDSQSSSQYYKLYLAKSPCSECKDNPTYRYVPLFGPAQGCKTCKKGN